jgi:glycine/D-amino acid oxidase-like deaminating enzyme
LRRDSRADVAALGGGLAGITGALEARRRGARVVLFEPGPIGGT